MDHSLNSLCFCITNNLFTLAMWMYEKHVYFRPMVLSFVKLLYSCWSNEQMVVGRCKDSQLQRHIYLFSALRTNTLHSAGYALTAKYSWHRWAFSTWFQMLRNLRSRGTWPIRGGYRGHFDLKDEPSRKTRWCVVMNDNVISGPALLTT